MRILSFWWHWLTSSSFRHWVYMHDVEAFMQDIENRRRDMLEHQSRQLFKP